MNTKKFARILLVFSVVLFGALIVLSLKQDKPPLESEENSTDNKQATVSPQPKPNEKEEESKEEPNKEPEKQEPEEELPPDIVVLPEISIGDTSKKQVIFTFDAGAGSQSAVKILETLTKYNVKGTFFFTGRWAEENKILAKQIATKHEVFNHTYNHPDLTTVSDQEIRNQFRKGEQVISGIIGKTTKPYFRPPYGARNTRVWKIAAEEGYRSVYWTVDALDWKESQGFTATQVKDRILSNLKPGAIYLMHIGDNLTGEVLDTVFSQIKAKGYKIVSLTQGL